MAVATSGFGCFGRDDRVFVIDQRVGIGSGSEYRVRRSSAGVRGVRFAAAAVTLPELGAGISRADFSASPLTRPACFASVLEARPQIADGIRGVRESLQHALISGCAQTTRYRWPTHRGVVADRGCPGAVAERCCPITCREA